MLRSKYADDRTPTKVDLTFEYAGKIYRVERNPEYERAKARGEEVEVTLTIFTGEDGAWLDYQKPTQRPIRTIKVSELEKLYNSEPKPFPAGSMGPKIKAVIEFVKNGGSAAYISKTSLFEETLKGEAGTTVLPD